MTSPDPSSSRAQSPAQQQPQQPSPDQNGRGDAAEQAERAELAERAEQNEQAAEAAGAGEPSGAVGASEAAESAGAVESAETGEAAGAASDGAAGRAGSAGAGRRTELTKRARAGATKASGTDGAAGPAGAASASEAAGSAGASGASRASGATEGAGAADDVGTKATRTAGRRSAGGAGAPPIDPARDAAGDEGLYQERVYRSTGAMATGVLLFALGAWLGGDALVRGEGRTPWLALAGLLAAVPLVVAFTVRPAVFAGADRLRVRNPFRTITLPWASVEGARAGYSSEVLAGGRTYQLWAIPVSLRQRKRASRRRSQAAAADEAPARFQQHSRRPEPLGAAGRAPSDQAIDDIRELAERYAKREGAQGAPVVRWAWEVLAPSAVGVVLLTVLASTG
ncbi:PH domain-containing protein [Streptomyces sp. HSW2009]|uniref:PH domain-containing protein n=1 Tax=Streptomyces sp. HSW2009 TaxID=3142890 RepID=UPI0032EE490E